MNIRELRIGNCVQRPEDLRIDILDGDVIYFGINLSMLMDFDRYGNSWAFEAIPLTDEWLQRFGFESRSLIIDNQDTSSPTKLYIDKGTAQVCRSGIGAINCPCKYVHQLQNLFYSLTGNELIIQK